MKITDIREDIEWIGIRWHDQKESEGLPRVLLIGDSITAGHGTQLRDALRGKFGVDYFATSKIVSDVDFMPELEFMLAKYKKYDMIIFNNGLHGREIEDDVYAEALEDVMLKLKECTPHLVWRTSTPCYTYPDGRENPWIERVVIRNKLAAEVTARHNIPTLNLYAKLEGKPELVSDGIHFKPEGYQIIVDSEVEYINKHLG